MPIPTVLTVFRRIRENGPISRTDLQHLMGLSWGTITNTTRDLLQQRLIREQRSHAQRPGRRPTALSVDTEFFGAIGASIHPREMRCIAMNLAGALLDIASLPLTPNETASSATARLAAAIQDVQTRFPKRRWLAFGVACAGELDGSSGTILRMFGSDSCGFALRDEMRHRFGGATFPVRLETAAASLALAECWFGDPAARTADNLLCITFDPEPAAGIIIRGELFRGSQGRAGNLSDVIDDRTDSYPRPSQAAIDLASLHAGINGDDTARTGTQRFGHSVGTRVGRLAAMIDPAVVVLADAPAEASPFFRESVIQAMHLAEKPHLVISGLGANGPAMGACAAVIEAAFGPGASTRADLATPNHGVHSNSLRAPASNSPFYG